jgi:phenylalanyl-tRNA synthetase beta chain
MKISLKWLNDYIDVKEFFTKTNDLLVLLTGAGLEVEGIENLAKNFDSVVIGCILKKDQHPNADRLTLCQVSTGDGVVHQIVCGAKNHKEGDKIVVALPGAVLPGGFAIKKSKIRDIDSGGMLCSEKELGMAVESEGLLILPSDAPVGQAFAKYMGFDDILFELKVTPNRADCLSHFGLARELSCLLNRELNFPIESLIESATSTRERVKLELKASDLCPRYAGRGVQGVRVGPSPDWLKKRLEAVGLKPINNVVDVTNFVMLELGQPLHAFDVRELKGGQVIVERAVKGEKFTTLDGTELTLDGTELTIRDQERAVALAGIIGGKNSGIQDDTTEIFIESAYFLPSAVRKTARKFGIDTDSSYRFARGTNPEAVALALSRASILIQKVAGGQILGEAYDEYPKAIRREPITVELQTVSDRLGFTVEADRFNDWMKRLGCELKVTGENAGGPIWSILPPLFRWDITVDMDFVEEFARLHGYQHIPESIPPLAGSPAVHAADFLFDSKVRRHLQGEGANQAINYAFVSRQFQARVLGDVAKLSAFGFRTTTEPVALLNPLNEEVNVMRTSLVPGLIKNVVHNSRHGNSAGRLFEVGAAHFSNGEAGERDYPQESRLAFAFWGKAESLWSKASDVEPTVFALKGAVENLLHSLGCRSWKWVNLKTAEVPEFLHPGQSAALQIGDESGGKAGSKFVGFIGTLHPSLADEYKVRENCAIGELNLEKLSALSQTASVQYASVSKMPTSERDLAFVMPRDLPVGEVETEIRRFVAELTPALRDVTIFDVFSGPGMATGQRSVAFRLKFQAQDTTLEDQVVADVCTKLVAQLNQKYSIALR